ncbi:M20 family metallopeptidase [Kallotenue papyrolyticum]|uniref:M20 family metallopeptidase n=1 Tax=Kallotenue papyrolyticum TaxID=1325125 RepID=UPI00047864B2|nr:M20 family metallopeptidase [Kallotenue papyrolyticum]
MSLRHDLAQLTMELVAIPSVSEDAAGRASVIDRIEQFCRALPAVHLARYESHGFPALVAAFDERRHKRLVLNAHVDVVPGRPDQFRPFERDGKIFGRGAQDMKGAAAAMLILLKALAEAGRRPDVAWQFVTDEEIGGEHGVGELLRQGYTTDFFLAGEPTDLQIVDRAKGIVWVTVRQPGAPAHGSRPWEGRNPLVPLIEGLQRLLQRYPIPQAAQWRTTVTPAALHSGDAHNRVPAEAVLKLDIRRVPEDDPAALLDLLRACFPEAEITTLHCGSALATAQDDAQVRRLAAAVEAVTGRPATFRAEHFGSDARFYSEVGTPAVCFGPHGAGLHSDEEWVSLDSLETFYQVLARLVSELE